MSESVPTDEREPLLSRESQVDAGELEASAPPEKKRSWWTIGWYAAFTILGVVLLALFIKGFIEADDVEVSIWCLGWYNSHHARWARSAPPHDRPQ